MTLGEVQKVLQNLLREKISIKDRVTKDMFAKAISDCDDYGMTLK